MTQKVYFEHPWIERLQARVVAWREDGFVPDRTNLFPEGGGQPSDEGTCEYEGKTYKIEKLFVEGEDVVHVLKACPIRVGSAIKLRVDPLKRLLHASLHTAGHWIGHILEKEKGTKVTNSYHFPQGPYVECETAETGASLEQRLMEGLAQPIDAKIEVTISDEGMRLVTIEGLGSLACEGTHLQSLGELPRVVLLGLRRHRGLVRVQYGLES